MGKVIENMTFDKEMAIKSLEIYLNSLKDKTKEVTEAKNNTLKEIESIKERKDRLVTLYLDKGLDKETYTKRYEKIESDLKALNKKLSNSPKSRTDQWDYVRTLKETGITMKDVFYGGDDIVKKDLLNSLCYNLFIQDGQIASVQYKMPWKVFEKVAKSYDMASWLGVRDSNPDNWDQNPESCR